MPTPTDTASPAVAITGLAKAYAGGFQALKRVDLSILRETLHHHRQFPRQFEKARIVPAMAAETGNCQVEAPVPPPVMSVT